MSQQRALVLGVTGRIGSRLAKSLIDEGWDVHGAARMSVEPAGRELDLYGITTHQFEVTTDDPETLPDVDTLFLEIWDKSKPELNWEINYYGVGRVVQRYAGEADIVNGSTMSVYGRSPVPRSESTPCRPDRDYGRSRYAIEKLIDYFLYHFDKRGIHIRYAHANSARHGVIRHMAESILAGRSLGPNPDQKIQVIGYEDFVRVTLGAVEYLDNPANLVNCCHPEVFTKRDLAEAIHGKMQRGEVRFDRESGGAEESIHGDPGRMIEWFGEPTIPVDTLIQRVANDLLAEG